VAYVGTYGGPGLSRQPGLRRCFEVDRRDLGVTRVVETETGPPGDGEVLFQVERFGLSANNVTYAVLGDALRYWDLFPADPGWGRIPVWGYLRVRSSRVPGIEAGRRAFGLCPMATQVVLRPERHGRATFTEGSPHRSGLASVYNVYSWADTATPGTDDALVVLRPVFWLSFTLDDYLSRQAPDVRTVIVTSASSKAAIGLAHLLTRRGVTVIGFTSASHQPFVDGLCLYDQVLPYDRLEALPAFGAVLVDLAGNAAWRDRIDRHQPGGLAQTVVAGHTNPDAQRTGQPAVTFFAPDLIRARAQQWGWPALEHRFQAALGSFVHDAASWLKVVRHAGFDTVDDVYQAVLNNAVSSPAEAHLINLTGPRLTHNEVVQADKMA
jgi:hypothetical protein